MDNSGKPEGQRRRHALPATLTVLIAAALACDTTAVTPTITPLLSPGSPTPFQPLYDTNASPVPQYSEPTLLPATELPNLIPIVPTTEGIIPFPVLTDFPQNWETGEDNKQVNDRMVSTIKADINNAGRGQYEVAADVLRQDYMNAVFNIESVTDSNEALTPPAGGTATFIGINPATNESLFITDTHVLEEAGAGKFRIRQPHTQLDMSVSLADMTIARSPDGDFDDIAVVKLPFIPQGVTAFSFTGSNLCVTQEPADNMVTQAFAFPYINGGPRFTEYFMRGNGETITDAAGQSAKCWYGEVQNVSPGIYIPTTMPVRVGASGALVLDQNQEGVGLVIGMSPHGAVVKPVTPALLQDLIGQTGFTFGQ